MKIKELLNEKSQWTQGAFARDKNGVSVSSRSPNAVCWCLMGAVSVCYRESGMKDKVFRKIFENLDSTNSIGAFNDNSSYEDVLNLVEKLDI